MRSFKDIKSHYSFTVADEDRIRSIDALMLDNAERAMDALHAWVMGTKETARYFSDEEKRKRVFGSHKQWFKNLFSGKYDSNYYERLIRIGQLHVKASVDAHYMNTAMNIIRIFCMDIINEQVEDPEERSTVRISMEKLLDINLNVITSSYIEEELKVYSKTYRVKHSLINFAEGFSQTMNLILILSLIGLTLGAIWLFAGDVYRLVTGNLEHGVITALGSMIILWVMIELMNTEIDHLKGGKFHISVFIGVALVAFIREALINTLKELQVEEHYYQIALIFVLGLVFWLVTRAEEKLR